ncbi:MAG: phage tail tape measure protein, partial [Pseudomonadota bacterium]
MRAEKGVIYEIGKANRWLKADVVRGYHDQIAAAKKLHAERTAEARKINDVRIREKSLIDINRELAGSYREVAGDARKASTDARLNAGPGFWQKFKDTWYGTVSMFRSVVYMARLVADGFRLVFNIVRAVVNVFVTIIRTWANVVTTALKMGAAVGGVVVGALALAAREAIGFETAMSRVGGVVGKMVDQMPQLALAIREIGKQFGMAGSEISQGAFQLASFGYGERETKAMLPGVTLLARASAGETGGRTDTERSSELVARMLLVWKRPAEEATRVANLLAAANAFTAATFERLYTAMPKASLAASLVNMSMEELTATISQLMNVGMEGGPAGAAFFGMIQRLVKPTKEMQGSFEPALKRIGLTMRDINPAIVGFRGSLVNLEKVYRTVTEAEWAHLVAVFRNRMGALALNAVVKQGVAEHDRLTQAITGTNQAQRQSNIMLYTVSGQWDRFKAGLRDLGIVLTDKMRGPLMRFLGAMANWFDALGKTPQVRALANALGYLAGQLADLALRLVSMIDLKKSWPDFVNALTGYMARAARVAIVGMGLIEYAFRQIADPASPLRQLWSSFWNHVVNVVEVAGGGLAGGMSAISRLFRNIFDNMEENGRSFATQFIAIMAEAAKAVAALPLRIKQFEQMGKVQEELDRYERLKKMGPEHQWALEPTRARA